LSGVPVVSMMNGGDAFDVAALVSDLVAIETENPPGNERPCAEFVAEWFDAHGVDAELVPEPDPERPQVGVSVGTGDPTVVLNGHLDVVPAGDRDRWTHPPYDGVVADGRIYGRGAADMKAGVAVGMAATAALAPALDAGDLDGTLVFHGAMGEETADPGTEALLDAGYGGDFGVNLEPTGLRTLTSAKGLAWYEFVVRGDPAHASRPDQGVNAVDAARPLLDAVAAYDDRIRDREDDLVGRAYATVTGFDAGTKENVVPEAATLTLDRRILPAESVAEVDAEIERLVAAVRAATGVDVSWERTRTYESAGIDHDSAFADAFRRHSARAAGVDTGPRGAVAATDVRTLVNHGDVEAIIWGPCSGHEAHTYDESVAVDDVRQGHEVLVAALCDVFESPPRRS
jgi:succinyl-diaminopimelate desuccinylase